MDNLLNPDIGMSIWTVVTFVLVALVLGRFAWKPILASIEEREGKLKADLKAAEDARAAAEKMRLDYERQMAEVEARTRELLGQAQKESQRIRDDMLKAAQDESARLSEKTRQQLAEEQRRLVQELRSEVVSLSVKAAEKLLKKSVDKNLQDKFVQEAMGRFEEWKEEIR
jgi:F-type H+-transporting ATPase subunit b